MLRRKPGAYRPHPRKSFSLPFPILYPSAFLLLSSRCRSQISQTLKLCRSLLVAFPATLVCKGKCPPWCHCRSVEVERSRIVMSGYTPDEKLRFQQLVKLRRQWLKDQELSHREPVLQPKPLGPVAKFWAGFLEPKSLWRLYVSHENTTTRYIKCDLI